MRSLLLLCTWGKNNSLTVLTVNYYYPFDIFFLFFGIYKIICLSFVSNMEHLEKDVSVSVKTKISLFQLRQKFADSFKCSKFVIFWKHLKFNTYFTKKAGEILEINYRILIFCKNRIF